MRVYVALTIRRYSGVLSTIASALSEWSMKIREKMINVMSPERSIWNLKTMKTRSSRVRNSPKYT